jgi:multidrug resistance efflux pump
VDHVQAPQQQRDAAHQVEKNEASHDLARPDLNRRIRLSPKGLGSNALLRIGRAR